ncbi:hypothetical protein [Flavobacterium sp.]|uniref:hypothetical protein n=1 Tax=Flavobacterium sp. TaxID=239 RepID=UPI00375108A5
MNKKYLFALLFFGLAIVALINYRTPFLRQDGGGWSIGYGAATSYPDSMEMDKNAVYSIEMLKVQNDSTVFLADPFFVKEKDTFYVFFEHKKTKQMRMLVYLPRLTAKTTSIEERF